MIEMVVNIVMLNELNEKNMFDQYLRVTSTGKQKF